MSSKHLTCLGIGAIRGCSFISYSIFISYLQLFLTGSYSYS